MALISPNLYIGQIGDRVKIIRDPGGDYEKVLYVFDVSSNQGLISALSIIVGSVSLVENERYTATFWLGYFYAHSVRPLPQNEDVLKENSMSDVTPETRPFNIEELKAAVVVELVTNYDMSMDEASKAVEESYRDDTSDWHENTDVSQMAELLAEQDDE